MWAWDCFETVITTFGTLITIDKAMEDLEELKYA